MSYRLKLTITISLLIAIAKYWGLDWSSEYTLCYPAAAIPRGCQADGTIYPEYPEEAECDSTQAKSRVV